MSDEPRTPRALARDAMSRAVRLIEVVGESLDDAVSAYPTRRGRAAREAVGLADVMVRDAAAELQGDGGHPDAPPPPLRSA